MNSTLLFVLIFFIALTIYAYCNVLLAKYNGGQEFIQCVEAGPTNEVNAEVLAKCSFYDKRKAVKDKEGKIIDTSTMMRVIVRGECMAPKKIHTDTQLLVQKIDNDKSMNQQIRQGDILLIYLKDTDFYKIRIFDKFDDDNNLKTYYYDTHDGHVINSSRPHAKETILGVVRYICNIVSIS